LNYRPWGYEPHGLTWLPHPAPTQTDNLYAYKPYAKPHTPEMSRTQTIAKQRIRILYNQAKQTYPKNPELSRRYTRLLQRISERTRTRLPKDVRRGICRNCDTVLIQGVNTHTRIRQRREPHVATTCHTCGYVHRIPLRSRGQ
jgi:ribonuclease P protein subunit RPR2